MAIATMAAELPTTAATASGQPLGMRMRAARLNSHAKTASEAAAMSNMAGFSARPDRAAAVFISTPLESMAMATKFSGTSSVPMINRPRLVASSFQR